ncbi:MAG: hypothetical protein RIS52_1124 [Pseudomonadota bacterium]
MIADAVTVRRVPSYAVKRGIALALQTPALRKMVKAHAPRVLMSAGNQSNLSVALACLGTSTASVAKVTNPICRPGAQGLGQWVRQKRFAATARLSGLTLTLSPADATNLLTFVPKDKAKIVSVFNPYVTDAMLATPARGRRADTPKRILSAGRLGTQKDHATLLNALARLARIDWRLDIIGDGPHRKALEKYAQDLGIAERVSFFGFVDALAYFQTADIFVLSSRWEGLPAVAIEAMACGAALVSTDCAPGLTDLLLSTGAAQPAPVGDADALAGAIDSALDAGPDDGRLRKASLPWRIDAAIADHLRLFKEQGLLPH